MTTKKEDLTKRIDLVMLIDKPETTTKAELREIRRYLNDGFYSVPEQLEKIESLLASERTAVLDEVLKKLDKIPGYYDEAEDDTLLPNAIVRKIVEGMKPN